MSEQREVIQKSDAIEAWHFLREDKRLQFGDREVVRPRRTISVKPPLQLCRHGLHASIQAINILQYAPGPVICRVKVWGEVIRGDDKLCGEHRSVLWMADATKVLHRFACDVATEALDLVASKGGEVDPRSRNAIAVKLKWLRGEATDEELAAAGDAAWFAAKDARDVAWTATWDAARAATRAAAGDAAWFAAKDAWIAAWDATWDAVRADARAAARDAQNRRLESMFADLRNAKGVPQR